MASSCCLCRRNIRITIGIAEFGSALFHRTKAGAGWRGRDKIRKTSFVSRMWYVCGREKEALEESLRTVHVPRYMKEEFGCRPSLLLSGP